MIARIYNMTASEGRHDELRGALLALAAKVRPLPGAHRVDLLRDQKLPANFVFIETWASADAAADGGKALGRDAFAAIMAALAVPPVSAQYDLA